MTTAPDGLPWPALMTVDQAALYLNVRKSTIQFWVYRTRTLPHVALGSGGRSGRKLCRIRKSVLDDMIARGERPAFRLVKGARS